MLPNATNQLWHHYVAREHDGLRAATLAALEAFIESVLSLEPPVWKAWARETAAALAEGRSSVPLPVRMPLFRRVFLPALVEAVQQGTPGAALTLVHFDQLLGQARGALPPGLDSTYALVREAIRLDSGDTRARRKLVELIASDFRYCLHELPAGVLFGTNAATAPECDELLRDLAEFRSHLSLLGLEATYAELSAEADLHFHAYREYLLGGRSAGSYAAHLERRSLA